jgi:hypothetical protein
VARVTQVLLNPEKLAPFFSAHLQPSTSSRDSPVFAAGDPKLETVLKIASLIQI